MSAESSTQYVAYTLYKADPAWLRLPFEERAAAKDAFAEVVEDWAERMELRPYSLVGVRPEADFLLWKLTDRYDDLRELGTALNGTPLAGWLTTEACAQPGGGRRALPQGDPNTPVLERGGFGPTEAEIVKFRDGIYLIRSVGSGNITVFTSDRGTITIGGTPHDECAGALRITDGLTLGSTVRATRSTATWGKDVWYAYTNPTGAALPPSGRRYRNENRNAAPPTAPEPAADGRAGSS